MVYCLICGCSDSEASKTHHFPTNSEKCKLWHDNLGIKYNNRNMKNYYLCSNHFDEHCYVDKVSWKLKRNALPMKYMNTAASSETNVNAESHIENCQSHVAGPSRYIHIDFPNEIKKSCDITKKIKKSVFRGIPGVSRKLSTPRKLKMMKLIESKESHIRSLKKLAKSRADNMRQLCSLGESSVVKELFKDMPSVTADFLITQLKCSNKSPKGRRWTINEKVLALALFKRGPKCYNLLRKIVAMPSKKTLTDLLGQVPFESGINTHILQHINNSIKSDEDRVCALLLDEMDIKEHIQYDSQRDIIRGYEEAGSQSSALANKALVFMVKGLQSSWKQPVAYYFTNNAMSGSVLSKLIIEVIEACQNVAHLDIVATINDCGTNNVKALKQLGSSVQTPFIQCGGKKYLPYMILHIC